MPVRDNAFKYSGATPKIGPLDARVVLIGPAVLLGLEPTTLMLFAVWITAWIVLDLVINMDLRMLGRVIRRRVAASGKATLIIMPPVNTRH